MVGAKKQSAYKCGAVCADVCGGGWKMNVYKANYFLAKGGQSCDAACQEVDRVCDESKVGNFFWKF